MQESNVNLSNQKLTDEDTSLRDVILGIRDWIRYFLSRWFIILVFGILGAALGLVYAVTKKPVYTATTSFVVEINGVNRGGLAAYAGLASSLGIDLGVSGGGLFEGENILELYKSRSIISRTLLSETDFNNKRQLLIDRFIEFNKIRERWKEREELNNIQFNSTNTYSNSRQQLLHDSIISNIARVIEKSYLIVEKIDKKLNIINVTIRGNDELFVKRFNDKLVENVNRFYLETKTKKAAENVTILQSKVDSVRSLLTTSINRAALVSDATPNQNATRMAQRVAPIQNATANAEINKNVLGTLLQNLELSKISLLKETPLIQVVDQPILPLEKKKVGTLFSLLLGGLLGVVIIVIVIIIRRLYKSALAKE